MKRLNQQGEKKSICAKKNKYPLETNTKFLETFAKQLK